MTVRKFSFASDLAKLETYLREQYLVNRNMCSWLPERLHDLLYRLDVQYADCGQEKSSDYLFLWEENGEIIGCILPDGDAIYMSIKNGHESMFDAMVALPTGKPCLKSAAIYGRQRKIMTTMSAPRLRMLPSLFLRGSSLFMVMNTATKETNGAQ